MAATVVGTPQEYQLTTAGNNHLPTFAQTTGDLVVIFFSTSQPVDMTTVGDGFNSMVLPSVNFNILWKVLDGSEGGNVNIVTDVSTKSCAIAYNITGFSTPPEISTVATGTSTGPDPDTVTPAGGSADYLWLAAFYTAGEEADDDTWCNSAPTNFTNLRQKTTGTGGLPATNCCVASAEFSSTASSMNPDAFNIDQSLAWRAYTMAVSPAPPSTDAPFPYIGGGYFGG